jgi:hypothetical protein
MEELRVLLDTADPCPFCGAPSSVYQQVSEPSDEWTDELRECSRGCTEIALGTGRPAQRRRSDVA